MSIVVIHFESNTPDNPSGNKTAGEFKFTATGKLVEIVTLKKDPVIGKQN